MQRPAACRRGPADRHPAREESPIGHSDDPDIVLTAGLEISHPAEDAPPRPVHNRVMQASCGSSHEGMAMMSDQRRWAVAVFGDNTESGQWQPGATIRALAVFGDCTLDMRQAITSGDEITVRAVAGFGDVRVMVPAGSRVEISGLALFGSKSSEVIGDPTAGGPVVRVNAWALFGDVKVA